MIHIKNAENCSGCSACASVCPRSCITLELDHEGFLYPHIDTNKCIDCGKCVDICPINNPVSVETIKPQAFAAWNQNEEIRKNSSSGGMFTLLAEKILKDGGAVFGASLTENFRAVHHIQVENTDDLKYLRGSKYLQSVTGDSYIQAKNCLDEGKPVLFTGTPCQIAGLHAYLGKDYPLLYTQDIICHGVPSTKVWGRYVDYRESEANSKTQGLFFRHKEQGWKKFSVQFEFENCSKYRETLRKDLFMRGFLADLYLRPSCHKCAFKGITRTADITLADFWGVNKLEPEMDDDQGTSLVLIHSKKGYRLFEAVKEQLKYKSIDLESAVAANSAAITSAKPHKNREGFFLHLEKEPFPKLISHCLHESPSTRAKNLIIRVLGKLNRTLNVR